MYHDQPPPYSEINHQQIQPTAPGKSVINTAAQLNLAMEIYKFIMH